MIERSGSNSGSFLLGLVPSGTLPKAFLAGYSLSAHHEATLRAAANEDARRYVYNAAISFISGVAGLHTQQAAWAVTKMYYTAFYVGRAALCRSGLVVFHVPKGTSQGNTQYQIRIAAGEQAVVVDKPASTHKLVAKRFRDGGYPNFMRGLQISGDDPILWLMEQREFWQYRAGRFPDPELPDVLDKLEPEKMPRLIAEYATDSTGLYLADPSHALVSVPFRLLTWALSEATFLSPGVIELDDVTYLRTHCRVGGRQLGALHQHLPRH
jgi:hypothetical protein